MKKIQNNKLVTKSYLDKKLNTSLNSFEKKIDKKVDNLKIYVDMRFDNFLKYNELKFRMIEKTLNEIKDEFIKFRDFTYDKLDWLVHEYQKFDQTLTIIDSSYPVLNDRINNHEKRITSLESKKPS